MTYVLDRVSSDLLRDYLFHDWTAICYRQIRDVLHYLGAYFPRFTKSWHANWRRFASSRGKSSEFGMKTGITFSGGDVYGTSRLRSSSPLRWIFHQGRDGSRLFKMVQLWKFRAICF